MLNETLTPSFRKDRSSGIVCLLNPFCFRFISSKTRTNLSKIKERSETSHPAPPVAAGAFRFASGVGRVFSGIDNLALQLLFASGFFRIFSISEKPLALALAASLRGVNLSGLLLLVNLYLKIFFSFFKLRSNREVRLAIGTHNLMENRISSMLFP